MDGLLTSQEIKKIRKSLGFTQEVLGELLGGGEKSFARYENGHVTQSRAMDNLLRILNDYPFVLKALPYRTSSVDKKSESQCIIYSLKPAKHYVIGKK